MDIHDSINPKAFSSYEEYQKALQIHDEFVERSTAASKVIRSAKTEEEERRGMEALGFTYHEDPSCRPWCEKREECLWCSVLSWQEECNDQFFGGLLSDADLLIPKETEEQCLSGDGCDALPLTWHQEESDQRKAILWFLDLMEALTFGSSRDIPFDAFHFLHPEMDEFVQQAYFSVLHTARGRPWSDPERGREKIINFLQRNSVLPVKWSSKLLTEFLSIDRTKC